MRVLILDDNEELRKFLALTLVEAGEDVVTVENAPEALSRIAEDNFDVFVVDSVMPDTDGAALVQEVRKTMAGQNVKILLMSSMGTALARRVARTAGCDEFMVKPFGPQQFIEHIKTLGR